MEKEEIIKYFEKANIGKLVKIEIDRGNGPFFRLCRFDGFDDSQNPILSQYLRSEESPLDLLSVGYKNINYII